MKMAMVLAIVLFLAFLQPAFRAQVFDTIDGALGGAQSGIRHGVRSSVGFR